MTFGTEWGWGSDQSVVWSILDRYLESGGNFLDTADLYTGGTSERLIGAYLRERQIRDRVVVATKFTFSSYPSDPNGGGNNRKHMMEALEGSLRRLGTDYVDLYWLHAWDDITPAEEVMASFDVLIRQGKVRYIGLSDVPAWYAARCQTLAEWRGYERLCALQLEYSLVERGIEREHTTAARELGLGITPWSPLASGLLTGKYARPLPGSTDVRGEGRLATLAQSGNPACAKFSTRNFDIVEALVEVSKKLGRTPAEVALNWVTHRPAVASTILGATSLTQLETNLRSLEFAIPDELATELDQASFIEPGHPYVFFQPPLTAMINGQNPVARISNF
jgi:aryl-alcohol dehydrogenase-like predicted oxidoreductase